jgi:flagellar biogenesis protein FliO
VKRFSVALAVLIAAAANAQTGFLGTKASPNPAPAPAQGVGIGGLIQMLAALAIVAFLLKFVLPKLAGKFNGKWLAKPSGQMKLEESLNVPGGALHLVTVRGRTFLLGVTPQAIHTVAEVSAPPQAHVPDPFEVTLLEASPFEPSQPLENGHTENGESEETQQEITPAEALRRLAQITGEHAALR